MLRKISGLTLIEVLVALAIVSIAMTAIIKATSQNIRSTSYLQNKTIAMWVGEEVLTEARLGVLPLPESDALKQSTVMLGQTWYWQLQKKTTPNQRIHLLSVDVYAQDPDENADLTPIMSFETYTYAK